MSTRGLEYDRQVYCLAAYSKTQPIDNDNKGHRIICLTGMLLGSVVKEVVYRK